MSKPTQLTWASMEVGDSLGPLTWTLASELNDEFLHACRTTDGARKLLGDAGQFGHPTFTVSDYSRLLTQRYGRMGSGLHARHRSRFIRPIPLGTTVVVTGQVSELYQRNDRDYWVIDYTASSVDGETFVSHTMTSTVDRADQVQPPAPPRTDESERAERSLPKALANRRLPIELSNQIEFGRQYVARFGEEFDPARNAHTDPQFAESLGLSAPVGYSGLHYAWFAEAALEQFGTGWLSSGTLSAKFTKPVFIGDEVTVLVTDVEDRAGERVATLEACRMDGEIVAAGEAILEE